MIAPAKYKTPGGTDSSTQRRRATRPTMRTKTALEPSRSCGTSRVLPTDPTLPLMVHLDCNGADFLVLLCLPSQKRESSGCAWSNTVHTYMQTGEGRRLPAVPVDV